jgi:hypothetical protein
MASPALYAYWGRGHTDIAPLDRHVAALLAMTM